MWEDPAGSPVDSHWSGVILKSKTVPCAHLAPPLLQSVFVS